jgi:NhaA family Na+:H+ antiporter
MSNVDYPPGASPTARRIANRVLAPVNRLAQHEAISGLVLLAAGVIALAWANSPWSSSYTALWNTPLEIGAGSGRLEVSLHFVVNDILMAIFFFAVGLEIRREMHAGELSTLRRAALPVVAALGGMAVPALIYLALAGSVAPTGWGVPMATDIAFAVGILALLGKRVPPQLRIFLLALAIIDDIGAILVIAIAYSSGISFHGIALALGGVAGILVLQRLGVRASAAYVVPAVVLWIGVYEAGIHPTIAGVIVGLMTPVLVWEGREDIGPLERMESAVHPYVTFGIMPIFALANAGVNLSGVSLDTPAVAVGISVALVVGKPLGVIALCGLAVRLRLATVPAALGWRGIVLAGVLAGIGFTMALFIAELAFTANPGLHGVAKLAVLAASAVAAIAALVLGRILYPRSP